jgi:hypothetical protein
MDSQCGRFVCVGSAGSIYDEGSTEEIKTADFISRLDALKGHDITPYVAVLSAVAEALLAEIQTCFVNVCADDDPPSSEHVKQVCKNVQALAEYIETGVAKSFWQAVVPKLLAASESFAKFKCVKNKTNSHGFNRAVIAWKEYKLPIEQQNEVTKGFLKHAIQGLVPAFAEHKNQQKIISDEALSTFKMTLREHQKIAGGTRDGSSWKESLDPGADLKAVLDLAIVPKSGLLAGPGEKVKLGKQTISEAPTFCAVWPD